MNTVLRAATRGLAAAVLHVLVGCATPDAGGADGGSPPRPVDAGPFDARDASASTDVATREVGVTDSACASIAATASVIRRPLDVIVVVDSSASFDRPRAAIGATLAPNLVRALEAASVDYRVVVVGGSIATPASPRYVALRESIGSTGLLPSLPRYLRRALPNLRLDSLKAIVDFTDDGWIATGSVLGTREEFYAGMAAPDLTDAFGTRMNRRYTFHAVAGLRPNAPSSAPWPPADPIVMDRCDGFASNPAVELQSLAIETGGFRFPLCNFMEYSGLFDAVAALAIENVRVPCEFGVPMTSDGRTPDIGYARMNVTIEDRTTTTTPVANEAACGEGFHLVRGSVGDGGAPGTSDTVRLCPATCARLRAEPTAVVRFTFECPPG